MKRKPSIWMKDVSRPVGWVLIVFSCFSIVLGWAMRDFIIFGAFFLFGGVYLLLHGVSLLLTKRL